MLNRFTGITTALMAAALITITAGQAAAAVINPTSVTVGQRPGAAAPTSTTAGDVYKDDVMLRSIIFGSGTISGHTSFSSVRRFEVLTGRGNINAEWGDLDTGTDGNDNPFVKAGLAKTGQAISTGPSGFQETTVPAQQDRALLNVFNSRSLSEMADGEGAAFSFKLLFANGLRDDDPSKLDTTPELLFVERGGNDGNLRVEAIIGGTFEKPTYSKAFTFSSASFWKSRVLVDTVEIDAAQPLAFGGIDFNDLGLGAGATVYGLRFTAPNGGADLNGMFLASADPSRFLPGLESPATVPVPASLPLLLGAVGGLAMLRRKRA